MANEQMEFPGTWEEYEKDYGFNDSKEVYTNNSRLIPSFRVKQWLDHLPSIQPKTDVLDKIRAKILEERECAYADFERYKVEYLQQEWEGVYVYDSLPQDDFRYGMERCVEIIDKYRKELE